MTTRNTARIIGAIMTFVIVRSAWAYDNGDWQFWNTDSAEYKIDDRLKTKAEAEFYFGDNMSDFYYWHLDAGLAYKVVSWFEAGANYRYVQEKKNGDWQDENRPHVNGTFSGNLGALCWADRNRFEYRMRESADDSWRYRNRLRVNPAAKWTSLQLQPYADGETFYDFDADDWNQNRLSAGVSFKVCSALKASLYYMLVLSRKEGDWSNANVIGLELKGAF